MATATEERKPENAAFAALGERYERLPIDQFFESKLNPRKTFNDAKLKELAASIVEKGVIEPLVARPSKRGDYVEIIAGARRYRAAKAAGLTHLPVVVREYTDAQAVEVMAIENGQRDDVLPLEEAAGYKQLLLIDKTYSPAQIAEKIGHTEKYVWDRLRLLELVPAAQQHLVDGRIGVEHAEILAKLKPSDQERAIHPQNGGVFDQSYISFDGDEKEGPYDRLKLRTVREFKSWISRHIRFDVQHAAAAAPLDFGPVAERVEEASSAGYGAGKAVIHITYEHQVHPDAQRKEKTYVVTAWRRADGKDKSKTCEHAVLGLVVTGPKYGQAFDVCTARETCRVHFADEIKQREKNAQLRLKGQGSKASQNEVLARQKEEAKRREAEAARVFWEKLERLIIEDATEQVKKVKALTAAQAKHIERFGDLRTADGFASTVRRVLGANWWKTPAAALLVCAVDPDEMFADFDDYVKNTGKPLGLNINRLVAIRDKHQPKPAAATPAKAKTAKAKKVA